MANVRFEYRGQISAGLNSWDRDSLKRITVELNDDDLSVNEMLEEFMNFMKAIGYNFDLGDHLEVVNDFKSKESHPGYGAIPPQPIIDEGGGVIGMAHPPLTVSETDNFTLEQLVAEFNRLVAQGMIPSAAEATARTNLRYREV